MGRRFRPNLKSLFLLRSLLIGLLLFKSGIIAQAKITAQSANLWLLLFP